MGKTGSRTGAEVERRSRDYRAQIKDLIDEMDAMLDWPNKYFPILLFGPDNTLYWENRDEIHKLGGDNLPEVKTFERKLLRKAKEFGTVIYDPEKDREGKPYSYWWWWLDKIISGELPKDLLPEHLRHLL